MAFRIAPVFSLCTSLTAAIACHSPTSPVYDAADSAAVRFQNTVAVPLTLNIGVDSATSYTYVVVPGQLSPAIIVSAGIPGVQHTFTITYSPAVAQCDAGWCTQPVIFDGWFEPGNRGDPNREADGSVIFYAPPKLGSACPVGYICYWVDS